MPFGMMSGVGREMGVLDRGGYCQKGRCSFVDSSQITLEELVTVIK